MKVRKLAVALALAGSMGSNLVYALGLGDADVKSSLNEPLRAEIDLVQPGDLTREDIIASLASDRDFQRVGIESSYFLSEIQFNVVRNDQGELVLQLTTRRPVREPYLNFLVEVAWPSGRLLREYALLIDPPSFRDQSAGQAQPAAAAPQTRPEPAQTSASSRQQTPEPARSSATSPSSYGPVGGSDTLWRIAQEVRPASDLTPQQVMLALQDANPDAFLNNNINLLREGSVLRIPDEQAIRNRTPREAVQQVSAQNRRYQQDSQTPVVDATDQQPAPGQAPRSPEQGGDELRLLAADAADATAAEDGSHGGETGGSGEGSANTQLALTREELDQTRRENAELQSRMEDLQSQLEDMRRLIQLQSDQMAALQAQTAASSEQPAADSVPDGSAQADGAGEPAPTASQQTPVDEGTTDAVSAEGETAGAVPAEAELAEAATDGETIADGATSTESAPEADAVSDAEPAAEDSAATAAAPAAEQEPETGRSAPAETTTSGLIQQFKDNPIYQLGAGAAALALLGLLWLLARKNARREEEFYARLKEEEAGEAPVDGQENYDALATGLAAAGLAHAHDEPGEAAVTSEETSAQPAEYDEDEDALAEADVYLAYGRLDQATQVLESAVEREPGRNDLRLRLLGIYADAGNEEGFAQQMAGLEATGDEAALAEAEGLRGRLSGEPDSPTIDDLESELLNEVGAESEPESGASGQAEAEETSGLFDQEETPESPRDERDTPIDFNLDDLDLDLEDESAADTSAAPADADDLTPEDLENSQQDEEFEFNLGSEESGAPEPSETVFSFDEADLEAELESGPEAEVESAAELEAGSEPEQPAADDEVTADSEASDSADVDPAAAAAAFDESFLDELDAELEKVTREDADEPEEFKALDSELDELELDVSDEDLAFIEEVSGGDSADASADTELDGSEDDEFGDFDFDLDDDVFADAGDESAAEGESELKADEAAITEDATEESGEDDFADFDDSLLEASGDELAAFEQSEADEAGDGDEFDFLEGTDEVATKLDLARAYFEMGDADGARDILEEVAQEGSDVQKNEAQELLAKLA